MNYIQFCFLAVLEVAGVHFNNVVSPRLIKRQLVAGGCGSSEVECLSRDQCISNYDVCDGVSHCSDGSDETAQACSGVVCPPKTFRCRYGACIHQNLQCDSKIDCQDGSDESNCQNNTYSNPTQSLYTANPSGCNVGEWACSSGAQCISNYDKCDGVKQCADGSDEAAQTCYGVVCQPKTFQCKYGACIQLKYQCDGKRDCNDGSDETNCGTSPTALPTGCNMGQWECSRGAQCISNYDKCDGVKQCADGSDETAQTCSGVVCQPKTFQCKYGACIQLKYQCDGKRDCNDGSDETNCGTSPTVLPTGCNELGGRSSRCNNGQCVGQNKLCNGIVDCDDGSDETEAACTRLNKRCSGTQQPCAYGACKPRAAFCDGHRDCPDGSDETRCSLPVQPLTVNTPATPAPATRDKPCVVPNMPRHRFSLDTPECTSRNCPLTNGQMVNDGALIRITCQRGFHLKHSEGAITRCSAGRWSSSIPECVKLCMRLESTSLDMTCQQGLDQGCEKPMIPGTVVTVACKPLYFMEGSSQMNGANITCLQTGRWSSPLPHCKPVCGESNLQSYTQPQILNGQTSNLGNFPWHSGIYHIKSKLWELVCGGTLISNRVVLTAAHCVTGKSRLEPPLLPKESMRVALGIYFRDWNRAGDQSLQIGVDDVIVHSNYRGEPTNFQADIALLVLEREVTVNNFIIPACLDRGKLYETQIVNNNSASGFIAGWGNTKDCDSNGNVCESQSEELIYTNTAIMSYSECYRVSQTLYLSAISKLSNDKYCAGDGNVSVVQSGDSGGGLTFVVNNKHYVYGIVSTKLKLKINNRHYYSFGAFTSVIFYMDWLKSTYVLE